MSAPRSDEKGESFSKFARHVELRRQATNVGPANRASASILHMNAAAREVCMSAESEVIVGHDEVGEISDLLHDCLAPDAVGSVNQEVARLSQSNRATEKTNGRLERVDSSRRKAESKMRMGGAFPGNFASVTCGIYGFCAGAGYPGVAS